MNLRLQTLNDDGNSTIGVLFVDDEFTCFTLEDTHNEPKIYGKTRIPRGSYEITLRKEGGMVQKYNKRYEGHDGMLWIRDVPNFKYVYIHVGNDEDDTDGCILVGKNCNTQGQQTVGGSVLAYLSLYSKVKNALDAGYPVNIEVV